MSLVKPVVGMAQRLDQGGYWLVATDGGVFAYGDAGFYGSMGGKPLNKPIVGMAATPDGGGYWLVASRRRHLRLRRRRLPRLHRRHALEQAHRRHGRRPRRLGYWLVASDGGIFSFGDAAFHGSMGGTRSTGPIVGMAATVQRARLLDGRLRRRHLRLR